MGFDDMPLSVFEVDCDGSACGSAVGVHVHPPQHGPAAGRVVVRRGERISYERAEGLTGLVMRLGGL